MQKLIDHRLNKNLSKLANSKGVLNHTGTTQQRAVSSESSKQLQEIITRTTQKNHVSQSPSNSRFQMTGDRGGRKNSTPMLEDKTEHLSKFENSATKDQPDRLGDQPYVNQFIATGGPSDTLFLNKKISMKLPTPHIKFRYNSQMGNKVNENYSSFR